MKKNGDIKVAVLQAEIKNLKENDLVHLRQDVTDLRMSTERKFDNIEEKIDRLTVKMAYFAGVVAVIVYIITRFSP